MILDQRNHNLVVRTVGVVEVSLVHQNHGLAWSFGDIFSQFILWRDAGGGIVRVANVNEPLLGRVGHFSKIMTKATSERNFHDLSTVDARVIENRFKGRIGRDEIAARWSSKCFRTEVENLARTVAEQ